MDKRKTEILKILRAESKPIKGSDLASKFHVTRQVIVQDIALLRAEGENIIATNRGYIIPINDHKLSKKIVCQHSSYEEITDELNTIVDFGGRVKDVIVDHPIYGELQTSLEIRNRKDVIDFMESLVESQAEPLSSLTDGVHIHTIEVDDEDMFKNIEKALLKKNYLTK